MRIALGPYQRRRMAERRITEEQIVAVLSNPDFDWPSRDAVDRRIYSRLIEGRTIRVVAVEGTDPVRVVTVWSSQ